MLAAWPEGLAAFKSHALGRGYVEKFPGSRGLRDTVHGGRTLLEPAR